MAKPKTEQTIVVKQHLSEEERLQRARARHAEEAARLEKRSVALTQKATARKKMEDDLRQERVYRTTAGEECVKAEAVLKEHRATWQKHNRRVVSLEFILGLRKRGQAPAEQPPAEGAESAQEPTSGAGEDAGDTPAPEA